MRAWAAKTLVVGLGVGAVFFLGFSAFGYRPDSWSYFWGIFAGSVIRDILAEWTR